jgi:hypothetical protein
LVCFGKFLTPPPNISVLPTYGPRCNIISETVLLVDFLQTLVIEDDSVISFLEKAILIGEMFGFSQIWASVKKCKRTLIY